MKPVSNMPLQLIGWDAAINNLRQQQVADKIPCVSENNARFLCQHLQQVQPKRVLEIGTCQALSTCYFAHTVAPWHGHVTSIELSPVNHAMAVKHVNKMALSNITLVLADARDYCRQNLKAQQFDWVFIDGQKSHTLAFFKSVQTVLAQHSWIVVDDAVKYRHKMQNFYDYLNTQHIDYTLFAVDDDDATLVIEFKAQHTQL